MLWTLEWCFFHLYRITTIEDDKKRKQNNIYIWKIHTNTCTLLKKKYHYCYLSGNIKSKNICIYNLKQNMNHFTSRVLWFTLTPIKRQSSNYCSNTDWLASAISLSCWQSLFLRVEISCWNSLTLSGSMPRELIWAARSFSTSAFNSENAQNAL